MKKRDRQTDRIFVGAPLSKILYIFDFVIIYNSHFFVVEDDDGNLSNSVDFLSSLVEGGGGRYLWCGS